MTKEQKSIGFSFQDVFPKNNLCNREEELFQYFENLLSEKDSEVFEKHLKTCSTCIKLLSQLNEANHAGKATVVDASKAEKIFDQTRSKLREHLKIEPDIMPNIAIPRPKSFSPSAYVNILLIGLVAALIYPSYKSLVLDKQVNELKNELDAEKSRKVFPQEDIESLKGNYEKQIQELREEQSKFLQPDLSGSAVYAVRTERSGNVQSINIAFGRKQEAFNLVFSVPIADFKNYLVEISDGDKVIWSDEIVLTLPSDSISGLISVNLKGEYFREATYRLRISGIQKNNPIQLEEFKLKVSHPG